MTDRAREDLRAIGRPTSRDIGRKLNGLIEHPKQGNIAKLEGHRVLYRLRVDDFRVIIEEDKANRSIVVLTVRQRGSADKP